MGMARQTTQQLTPPTPTAKAATEGTGRAKPPIEGPITRDHEQAEL
jgi:hypothetical protein